jgi:hypothetical protein
MAKLSISDVAGAFSKGPDPRDSIKLESSLKGYNDFKKALKQFDNEQGTGMRKAMDREIRAYLKPIVTDAQSMIPDSALSGWRTGSGRGATNKDGALPNYDKGAIRKGVKVRQGQKKRRRPGEAVVSAWELRNEDGAGSAFEGAGRRGGKTAQGRRFIAALSLYHGKFPRLIWRAWGNAGGDKQITADVVAIVKLYESKLELAIKSAKD